MCCVDLALCEFSHNGLIAYRRGEIARYKDQTIGDRLKPFRNRVASFSSRLPLIVIQGGCAPEHN